MKMKKFCIAIIVLLFSNSCVTAFEKLSAREGQLRSEGRYSSYLALEYLEFSRNLLNAKKKRDSEYFAIKGLKLVDNRPVFPENPDMWDADRAQMEELILMQKRLELILQTPKMKFYLPIQLAHLSYLYDCWVSREAKPIFRVSDLAQCKNRFYKLMEEIEYYIDEARRNAIPKVKIFAPEFKRFEIFFDLNSYQLTNRSTRDLAEILKYIQGLKQKYKILIVGNADRVGKAIYNQSLSIKRSEVVKNHLVKSGVMEDFIEARSIGESLPDILTKDGVQKQENRRVGVYILEGVGDFSSYPLPLVRNHVYKKEIEKARKKRGLD